jgi:hypothetical protein
MTCWKRVTITRTLLTRYHNTTSEAAVCPRCGHDFGSEEIAWSHANGKLGSIRYYCEACYKELWV